MALVILKDSPDAATLQLTLDGRLDALTAPELEQPLADVGAEVKTLILDLGKLGFVSSAGLRVFAKARKMMRSRDGKLCFVNLSPQVQKVFEIVKVVSKEEVFCSLEELDAYLATMQRKVTEAMAG